MGNFASRFLLNADPCPGIQAPPPAALYIASLNTPARRMSNAWRGLRVTRRAPADARLRYPRDPPRDPPQGTASHNRFDFAFMVANLQARGRPAPRHEFVAHHASVLLSLLLERARFRALLEQRQRDDEERPRTVQRAQAQRAATEGARSVYVVLDAVTRTAHTKKYTIECNRAAYRAAIATLLRSDDEAWKRVHNLLLKTTYNQSRDEQFVRFECSVFEDGVQGARENRPLCAFLAARTTTVGKHVMVSAAILNVFEHGAQQHAKDSSAELFYRVLDERYDQKGGIIAKMERAEDDN